MNGSHRSAENLILSYLMNGSLFLHIIILNLTKSIENIITTIISTICTIDVYFMVDLMEQI